MKDVSNKFVEKIKTHILCQFFFSLQKITTRIRYCGKTW